MLRVLGLTNEWPTQGLCNILPNDNRIHHYFGALGINSKCVTEMSNMIAGTLKGKEGALRVLQNV